MNSTSPEAFVVCVWRTFAGAAQPLLVQSETATLGTGVAEAVTLTNAVVIDGFAVGETVGAAVGVVNVVSPLLELQATTESASASSAPAMINGRGIAVQSALSGLRVPLVRLGER